MPAMADDGRSSPDRRRIADLFLLGRWPRVAGVLLALLLLAIGAVVSEVALRVQHHFALVGGGRLAHFLAQGGSVATVWTGWAAALFFAIAVLRLRHGAPEPPAGRTPLESMTLPQMRAGLHREYTVVRAALDVVSLVALLDVARAVRYAAAAASGDALAGAGVALIAVEAAGLVAAAAVLCAWAVIFRAQLGRLGALRR